MDVNRIDDEYESKMVAFEIGCQDGKGEALACHQVGEYYSVVKDDHARAAKTYQLNCDRGYGPSCFNLGRLFLGGKGVEQSDDKALGLLKKACDTKHLQACNFEGMLVYANAGKQTGSTPKETEELIKKAKNDAVSKWDWACKEGEFESCNYAGSHYLDPKNTERDPIKAKDYFVKACASNHAPSCYNLAVMYRLGDTGIEKNEQEFEKYKNRTNELVKVFGGVGGGARTG